MKNLLFAGLLLLTGCAPYRIVRNQSDPAASWSTYQTFAFVDTTRITPTPGDANQAALESVKQAVTNELRTRGYQPTSNNRTTARPDLFVNVGTVVQEKTQTRPTNIREAPVYIGQRRYSWRSQDVPVGTYQEGTVSLHVVDAQRNALVWDAAVAGVLNRRSATAPQIAEAVARLFERFPARNK